MYNIPQQYGLTRKPRTSSKNRWVRDDKKGNRFTIPKINYKYSPVSWELFLNNIYDGYTTVRSSFIPYVVIDNEKHWLLGSFHDFPRDILMDFGGSCIIYSQGKNYQYSQGKNYQHQFGCAMLELNEESKGVLVQPVLKSLGEKKPIIYRGVNTKVKEYVWFIMVELNYNMVKDIPIKFLKAPYVLKGEKLGPLDFYKESDIVSKYRTSRNLTDFMRYYNNKL